MYPEILDQKLILVDLVDTLGTGEPDHMIKLVSSSPPGSIQLQHLEPSWVQITI